MQCYVTRRHRQAIESNIPNVRRLHAFSNATVEPFELGHLVLPYRLPRLELQALERRRLSGEDTDDIDLILVQPGV